MRIEVGDPRARYVKAVYLDGERIYDAIAVDVADGYADLVRTDEQAIAHLRRTGVLLRRRVYGRVSIEGVVPCPQ